MDILFALIPLTLLLVAVAIGAYVWSVRDGQFDDLDTPPLRMLADDEVTPHSEETN